MLIIYILLILHKVGACSSAQLHLRSYFIVAAGTSGVLAVLTFSPVLMVQHGVGGHRHVLVSKIKLVHRIKIAWIEPHHLHVGRFRIVHFVALLAVRVLLVHHLVLCKGAASKVCLVHLHRVLTRAHHVDQHRGSSAAIRSCSCVGHTTDKLLALNHAHLAHLIEVNCQGVHLLVHSIIDAHLGLSSALLRCHGQVIRLIHGILVLTLFGVQSVTFLI